MMNYGISLYQNALKKHKFLGKLEEKHYICNQISNNDRI